MKKFEYLFWIFISRAWFIELFIMFIAAGSAHFLWNLGSFRLSSIDQLVSYIWSTLPVLAISNALPMLGASAVLSRYAVTDKPAEAIKQIVDVFKDDRDRLYSENGTILGDRRRFEAATLCAPTTLKFFEGVNPLFTPRPHWDGVWYFGGGENLTYSHRKFHELAYCSIRVVRLVHKLLNSGVGLVGGKKGGTNGSKWFLESLLKAGTPTVDKDMTAIQAKRWVYLAADSLHYMREELIAHQQVADANEARDTEFIDIFCDYLQWLGYFHRKTLETRWVHIVERWPIFSERACPPTMIKTLQSIDKIRENLDILLAQNLPRRDTATRILQIRRGVLLPLLGTGLATMLCLFLKPLSVWQPHTALSLVSLVYCLIAASLSANFMFGLWLLIPSRSKVRSRHE